MREYLVQWKNLTTNEISNLIKTWQEVLAILKKMTEVGGEIHIYRLDKSNPERVFPVCINHTQYWLEDMYGNFVEG